MAEEVTTTTFLKVPYSQTSDEIMGATYPGREDIVEGLVPVGLTILAANPKVGKSCMAFQIARGVASGQPVLGREVKQGNVLYFAFDYDSEGVQELQAKQKWESGLRVHFMTNAEEGEAQARLEPDKLLQAILKSNILLVVIDPYARAFMIDSRLELPGRKILQPLQQLALAKNVAILVADHNRKGNPQYPDEAVTGVGGHIGKVSIADALLSLKRKVGDKNGRLEITGRIPEALLKLEWHKETLSWAYSDSEGETIQAPGLSRKKQELLDAVQSLGKAKAKQITDRVGGDLANNSRALKQLVSLGLLEVDGDGQYNMTTTTSDIEPITTTTTTTTYTHTDTDSGTGSSSQVVDSGIQPPQVGPDKPIPEAFTEAFEEQPEEQPIPRGKRKTLRNRSKITTDFEPVA